MTPEQIDVRKLAAEIKRLADTKTPVATFTVGPLEAYTLTAVLQATSRNPQLSATQRAVVLDCARTIFAQLRTMATAVLGEPNVVTDSLATGWDPANDRPASWRPKRARAEPDACRGDPSSPGGSAHV